MSNTTNTTTEHFSDTDLAEMVAAYRRDHRIAADSQFGDGSGDAAFRRIEEMCRDLDLAGQMGEFLALLRD